MKYRIMLSVGFDNKTEAETAWNWIKSHKDKFLNIAQGEPWFIQIHKCRHDETPRQPCTLIEEYRGQ